MAHIIIIFDRSGSMGDPFLGEKKSRNKRMQYRQEKIYAAKLSLINWLKESKFDTATIIPFSSKADRKITASLNSGLEKIKDFVHSQNADGRTNLQSAISRAIKTASKEPNDSYVQYLIVTDGLSHTIEKDIELVRSLPISQSVSGILIDPSPDGENHLRQLCVRGSYSRVESIHQFKDTLTQIEKNYSERITLSKRASAFYKKNKVLAEKLTRSAEKIQQLVMSHKEIAKIIFSSKRNAEKLQLDEQNIKNKIADQSKPVPQVLDEILTSEEKQKTLEIIVNLLDDYSNLLQELNISAICPRFLAKGHKTTLFIKISPVDKQIKKINQSFRELGIAKKLYNATLVADMTVNIKLESSEIVFSQEVTKKILKKNNVLRFTAEPEYLSNPGAHEANLLIYNKRTGKVFFSEKIKFNVVGFAFGKVSQPKLICWAIIFLSVVSFTSIIAVVFEIFSLFSGLFIGISAAVCSMTGLILYLNNFHVNKTIVLITK